MPEAPTGTVTLVFTDIQGSTALWEHFGEEFKALLNRHNTLFRAAIEEFGGYEVKTEGDAFMVAFQDAKSAVAMCLAMQERLQEAEWPDGLNDAAVAEFSGVTQNKRFQGLRVRMGVHTGTPDCQPDPVTGRMDYFGQMVNRAARVGGVGHGGQLVVSNATWEAVDAGPGAGVAVEALGEHALKGLERREHLWQLLPAALSSRTFPRLKTPNLKKTNLPTRLDSFFGREKEMVDLEHRIKAGQRFITLLGAGGTGKTRLSQHFGGTQLANFVGGVWIADFTEARNKSGVLSAMGTALETPLTSKEPEAQLANAILGRGRVLIILDNLEQVAEHASETVGRWLQRAPEAVFLVTSRTRLRIEGEEVLYLDPLPVAEAVNLFFDRARAVQPTLVRDANNESVVTEIVARLDCLSLAVELAAARVQMLSPEKILERLSQRFKLLRGQRRDQSARQATLRGAFDWSWGMLKPHEQSAMSQLSVFHGGCTLEAAEAVVDLGAFAEDPWVLDVVEALVDHSLLRMVEPRVGHFRYRMLESIREYAAEKLGAEAEAVALRHAEYFAAFGEEGFVASLDTHGGVDRRVGLTLELENLLVGVDGGLAVGDSEAASACALAAAAVVEMHGPIAEGVVLLKRLAGAPVCRATQVRLSRTLGILLKLTGRMSEAQEYFVPALSIARELRDRRSEGVVLGNIANLHREQGRGAEALEHYHQALAIAREVGNRQNEGVNLGDIASLHRQQGRVAESLELLHQSLSIAREVGDRHNEGIHLSNLANLHLEQGAAAEALEYYDRALAIHREVGGRRIEGLALGNLAVLHRRQGRMSEAFAHFHQALAIARDVGNRRSEGIALGNLGDLLFAQGDLSAAETHLQQAIVISDEVLPGAAGSFRSSLALIRAGQGDFDDARALLARGELQVRGVHKLELGKLMCTKARVEHLAGDPDGAAAALAEAESIAAKMNVSPDSGLGKAIAKARAEIG